MTDKDFFPQSMTTHYLMTPAEVLERFGSQLSEAGKQQLRDMEQNTKGWPQVMQSTMEHKQPIPWEPQTEEDLIKYRQLLAGEITKQIRDWKECGALKNAKDISDGYHTFGELYETRAVLTIALFKAIQWKEYQLHIEDQHKDRSLKWQKTTWRSKLHSDGSMFDGMFILGLGREPGKQITFHYHLDKWDDCDFAETLEKAPEWDGHTSADVLERIKRL